MRYVAQRFGTWETLHRELPLDVPRGRGPEWGLTMYGVLEGTIAPEHVAELERAEDGRPVLEEWGTVVHVETGSGANRRRWSGIVDRVRPVGKSLNVRVRELLGYLDGLTYTGNIRGVRVDPVELLRQLWVDTQAQDQGDFGVTVRGATGLVLGTDSDIKAEAAKRERDAAKKSLEAVSGPRKAKQAEIRKVTEAYVKPLATLTEARKTATDTLDMYVKNKESAAIIAAQRVVVANRQAALTAKRAERDAKTAPLKTQLQVLQERELPWKENLDEANEKLQKAQEQEKLDGGSIRIEAADFPDSWKEAQELANEYGFELTTQTVYRAGRPDYRVQAHYPRAGKVRDDLVFQQGANIRSELVPDRVGYASQFLGRGAGEGVDAIRHNLTRIDKRARRNKVVARPSAKTTARLRAEVDSEARASNGSLQIPSIVVTDSTFAPMWSWSPGDSIYVQGYIPHVGRYGGWHRIKSWRLLSEYEAELFLEKVVN